MSDISQLASRVLGEGEWGTKVGYPYNYTTWLKERGREGGGCVPSHWAGVTGCSVCIPLHAR